VVVIGGGFTAVDCARACARAARRILGSEHNVTITYRRSEHHMAADMEELEEIKFENIEVRTLSTPLKVNTKDGAIVSVTFQRNKLTGQNGADGKPAIEAIPGSEFDLPCRHLIVAIGQDADWSILPKDLQPAQSPTVFTAGEFQTGSSDVIHCVADGKDAAQRIDTFLTGKKRKGYAVTVSLIQNPTQTGRTRDHDLQRAPAMPMTALHKRVESTAEVMLGHDDQSTATHATRCYLCNYKFEIDQDKCIHCDWCIDVAPRDCIKRVSRIFRDADGAPTDAIATAEAEKATFIYIDSNECIRCGKCQRACPTDAITMRKMERVDCASEVSLHDLVSTARADGRLPGAGGWTPLRAKV